MHKDQDAQGFADLITLQGDDGHSFNCEILHTFAFDDGNYALVLNLGEANFDPKEQEDEETTVIILKIGENDGQKVFQTIESEEEFTRVVGHVEEMLSTEQDGE